MLPHLTAAVDLDRLGGWLADVDPGAGDISDVAPLAGGTQNTLMRFTWGGRGFVLRLPPAHTGERGDATIKREAAVLAALAHTDVPHARLMTACDDPSVLGAAFLITEEVDGFNPTTGLADGYRGSAAWRRALGLAVVDAAASLGNLDHERLGLGALGRPSGFLARQVERWELQLESYRSYDGYRETLDVASVGRWLDANRPPDGRPGLVHGDLHLANVLLRRDRPSLAAIVDWELATLGDPLVDLGWLMATWPTGGAPGVEPVTSIDPVDGLPTLAELVQRYRERSGRDLSHATWYEVLACYKLGIVLEGTYARACAGLAPASTGDRLHRLALGLLDRARARINDR